RRDIGNRGAGKQELRAGIDGDRDLGIVGYVRVRRNDVGLAPVDLARYGAPITALPVEGGEKAARIPTRLGQQSGGTRSGFFLIGNEARSAFNGGFQIGFGAVRILAVARGRDLDRIGLRIDDIRVFLLVLAPQADSEQ